MKYIQASVIRDHLDALEQFADVTSTEERAEIADVLVEAMLLLDTYCKEHQIGIYDPRLIKGDENQ